jgi:hypothetical protein
MARVIWIANLLTQLFLCITASETNKPLIRVHVVPHSHVDPMWLFTSKEYTQRTQLILETTILTLLLDTKKTFVWESIYFLDAFLTQQGSKSICSPVSDQATKMITPEVMKTFSVNHKCMSFKESFLLLLQKKQIELVGGGWISYDEALTDFSSGLSDMALGRSWIVDTFGME